MAASLDMMVVGVAGAIAGAGSIALDSHDDVTTGFHLTHCQAADPHGHGIVITFASALSPASENFRE